MYTSSEIQQARASADTKLSLTSYSQYLSDKFGLRRYCDCNKINLLLLIRFVLSKWDVRPGAVNPITEVELTGVIKALNKI